MLLARRTTLLSVAGLLALGFLVFAITGSLQHGPLPYVGRGGLGGAILFFVTGLAAAARLTPGPLRPVWPVFALPAGAALGSLGLTAFGFAAVPLDVSLWIVLAMGAGAWWRWGRGRAPKVDAWAAAPWVAAGLVAFLIATLPAFHLNETTIFGTNPDSHQVTGSAVLFQHAPAWGIRAGLPINQVPPAWQFRYPILYGLAGASNLAHFDPVFVFPGFSALLVVLAALGVAALAVIALRLPLAAGPWVAMTVPLNALVLHMTWHPYYNQLWGLALLPWVMALGWWAARERSRSTGIAFVVGSVMLALAYTLVVFYPVLLIVALAWAYRLPRPRIPRPRGALQWTGAVVVGVLLLLPVAAAGAKIVEGLIQLFDIHANLWGGDIFTFTPLSAFVGSPGGVATMLVVLAVAAGAAARLLTRREALGLAAVLAVVVLFDVRLRISDRGQYMDFKHLGYVGTIVLALAAGGLAAMVVSRRRELIAAGLVLAVAWTAFAVARVRDEVDATPEQVTADMLELRQWAARLPADASIRLDIPPSGNQLWAQYMLAGKRLGSPFPVVGTTYAHVPFVVAGDYVLTPRFVPNGTTKHRKPWPRPPHAGPVIMANYSFLLRPLHMPHSDVLDVSSKLLVP
ncbi:MAG: hypothetical protein JWM73_1927 [Solirubrobacterales bacterium]|nr:hypothetical protein [Solirubrobacterales bacterium]